MRCPFCAVDDDKVIDSRASNDGYFIRRRRECLACNGRFTTYERIEETPVRVVKRDGTREDFERRKIMVGLITACQKRPVSMEDLEVITQAVEAQVLSQYEREVETQDIGEMVMRELRELDPVAYVRFASVYKNFESPEDFVTEVQTDDVQTEDVHTDDGDADDGERD